MQLLCHQLGPVRYLIRTVPLKHGPRCDFAEPWFPWDCFVWSNRSCTPPWRIPRSRSRCRDARHSGLWPPTLHCFSRKSRENRRPCRIWRPNPGEPLAPCRSRCGFQSCRGLRWGGWERHLCRRTEDCSCGRWSPPDCQLNRLK